MRFISRLLLTAFAFTTILPMIHGINFHGNFGVALVLSLVFGVLLWAVEAVAKALAAIFTITSFGLALLWIIPVWILGFWILPATALIITADLLPHFLSIQGVFPAVLAGLVMLGIGLLTSEVQGQNRRTAH
ncbi:MAG: phage holin family protein [Candidatus Obscuribacterales bacterium]|jgi:uncharacterized membrane protein YvlD (DUF360 family)|nr:phage holin family protein [Candidatus Obscuribacterales bacterium]